MTTVNTAAKTLVAVASKTKADRWRPADHMRYMLMLMTWTAVWFLRALIDHLPSSLVGPEPSYLLQGYSSSAAATAAGNGSFDFPPLPSSALTPSSSLDLVHDHAPPSAQGLGRSLTHIFALLNEMPASSRKYQFAVSMADKIVDENTRNGHVELMQINRVALSSAFARTLHLLYRSLKSTSLSADEHHSGPYAWAARVVRALPMGSVLYPYVRSLGICVGTIYSAVVAGGAQTEKERRGAARGEDSGDVVAEKHAQELMWITNKMMMCGAVDEAVVQWSLASGLASLSLSASPRVQGSIVKISSILIGELTRGGLEVPGQVKYRLLVHWLPLLCFAENGLSYPVLTGYEKIETERTIDQVISTLPQAEQEVILTNWLQDFSITSSDWPNLQISYDRWCHSTRKVLIDDERDSSHCPVNSRTFLSCKATQPRIGGTGVADVSSITQNLSFWRENSSNDEQQEPRIWHSVHESSSN
ncbi:hypothetical protein Vadar_001451 [Vaccinium darrowii]|uniref:Uncharacterized protein n=1 Tax=Vaccinium darrowii TaxID=229202 RepID=A0ACB7YSG9_9ERIC|nr:hypothetical protein Vadar_001451 [Vaccinium darrowii]